MSDMQMDLFGNKIIEKVIEPKKAYDEEDDENNFEPEDSCDYFDGGQEDESL